MEAAGIVLAAVGTVDLCLKYGNIVVEACVAFKNAGVQIDERILSVRSHWKRTSLQLDFLKRIWHSLDEEHQDIQSEILNVLSAKLTQAYSKLQRLEKPADTGSNDRQLQVKRFKFVFVKDYLDKLIRDLASWQAQFDPSWFLILKVADPAIDRELLQYDMNQVELKTATGFAMSAFRDAAKKAPQQMNSIFLPEDGLKDAKVLDVAYSTLKYVQRVSSEKWLVVETMTCDQEANMNNVTNAVRTLARKLSCGDVYTFGLLKCRGVVRKRSRSDDVGSLSFDFVFEPPKEFRRPPNTLRSILMARPDYSLTDRLVTAKQLARAIAYVHILGFVHKNIRPETVLRFGSQDSTSSPTFLAGFEKVRLADGHTLMRGDTAWEKNLYRHPDRQGLSPEEMYTMQHDIYSLGVCLVEIGMWRSFVSYGGPNGMPVPEFALGLSAESTEFKRASLMKEHLVDLAKANLPTCMGEIYTDSVLNCLTCLDDDNLDFGNPSDFQDADGVVVGVRYIEKILQKLESICV